MQTHIQSPLPNPVQRKAPDLGFDDTLPKYWYDGNAFKTRFFDAMSTVFPEGEKYFIQSVRAYREQISDAKLLQEVRDFTYQEAQHSIAHRAFNHRLKAQGIDTDKIDRLSSLFFNFMLRHAPKSFNIASTAGAEHLTAIMAHIWMHNDIHRHSDQRMRALYYWHSVEEIEHKAVAFDVMQKIAGVGYLHRIFALLCESILFPFSVYRVMGHMLAADKLGFWRTCKIWAKGLVWLHSPKGPLLPLVGAYFSYFRPGFHPWQEGQMQSYQTWRADFDRDGNFISASNSARS